MNDSVVHGTALLVEEQSLVGNVSFARLTPAQRIVAFLAAITGIIWLGGSIVRAAIGFDMFVAGTLTFKAEMPPDAMLQSVRLFAVTAFYTMLAYGVFLLTGLYVWLVLKPYWKQRGGLFIAGLLVLLYVPVEVVQMYYDIQIVQMVQFGQLTLATLESAKILVVKRITVLSGAPLLAMLGYISAVWFLVYSPLRKAL
jgi:hypothetical protein